MSFDKKKTTNGINARRKIAGIFVRIARPKKIPVIIKNSFLGFLRNDIRDNRHRSINVVSIASKWISLEWANKNGSKEINVADRSAIFVLNNTRIK